MIYLYAYNDERADVMPIKMSEIDLLQGTIEELANGGIYTLLGYRPVLDSNMFFPTA